jgi:choice-of-anchor A domain-containing protein
VQLNCDTISGNLVTTGNKPSSTGGTVTGSVTGNSSTLSADIAALQSLSQTLAGETGTSVKLSSGMTINASSGTLDSAGDEVFTITQWANNITINGNGANAVVLNIGCGVTPSLDNVTLTGGITANQVLFNDTNSSTITSVSGTTFNGTFLAPNAAFNVSGVTVNGHLFGGGSGQAFTVGSGSTLNTPANVTASTPATTTVSASDSTEVQVLSGSSPITVNGTAPTGSLSSLYGTAEKIEFTYSPGNTVSLQQLQAGLASVSGSNSAGMAFLEITNNTNPFASNAPIYFEGEVQAGEKIFADATLNQLTNTVVAAPNNHFSTLAGADIYAYVFASQAAFQSGAAPVQTMAYNTSGSQAMHLGDQIGSLTVVGYVGTNGGHLVS